MHTWYRFTSRFNAYSMHSGVFEYRKFVRRRWVLTLSVLTPPPSQRVNVLGVSGVFATVFQKVPENDRLIRKPEALLTLLLDACYAWSETAPDERGERHSPAEPSRAYGWVMSLGLSKHERSLLAQKFHTRASAFPSRSTRVVPRVKRVD